MKRISLYFLVITLIVVLLAGCMLFKPPETDEDQDPVIGLVTGSLAQEPESNRAAQNMIDTYGNRIIHVTYPDNFMSDQESTIATIVELAHNEDLKAIVILRGIPGTIEAIRQIREFREDILFLIGEPMVDPALVNREASIALTFDLLGRAETIVELAHNMGAEAFIHYTFPRHMSVVMIAARCALMEETANHLGMEFFVVLTPDPVEVGITEVQEFILADVPEKLLSHGEQTNFFGTSCAMLDPLIQAILVNGGIFAEQCCPLPTHGYPTALGIEITEEMLNNTGEILVAIDEKIVELGGAGRFASSAIIPMSFLTEASVELAISALTGEIDLGDINQVISKLTEMAGVFVNLKNAFDEGNYYLFNPSSIIFGHE